jgi:pilus assembly protein CpaE
MREMLKVVSQRTVQTNQQLVSDEGGASAAVGGGRVYAVFSPRGGSGKTTVAVNLAMELASQWPERVALLDLDLTFGHAALLLNVVPETSLAAVPPESLGNIDRQTLSKYISQHPKGLQVLVGGTKPEEGEAVTGDHVRAALGVMKRQFVATVVDCSGSFSDPVLAALEIADKVVVVATPELNTLRDIRECQRIFGEVIHLEKGKAFYVLNYYQPFKVLSREQFEQALEQSVNLEIPHAGDQALKAAMKGEPIVLGHSGSPFAKAIEKLAFELTPEDIRAAKGKAPRLTGPTSNGAEPARKGLLGGLLRR